MLTELVQNAWDQNTARVEVTLEPVEGRPLAWLTVTDDDPEGFADLCHAFTLFAESAKKSDPGKRGLFNLGEKLVLALCEEATITSTSGAVVFDSQGRHRSRRCRDCGSEFRGLVKMTRQESEDLARTARVLLPPEHVVTTFNGEVLPPRTPFLRFRATLSTVVADDEGILQRRPRETTVELYEPLDGETPHLYELGIPVVEIDGKYHVNIHQRVPVSFERDNVPPAFLKVLNVLVFNETHDRLDDDDMNQPWARHAVADTKCCEAAVKSAVEKRFGSRCVSYDPSDPEANGLAASRGYTVVTGSQMGKQEWASVKRAGAIRPAGQVTPSPKPYSDDAGALPERLLPPDQWTPGMRMVVTYATEVAHRLLGVDLQVRITNDSKVPAVAAFSKAVAGGKAGLMFNVARLGYDWFDHGIVEAVDELLIHEFGHHYCGNHLDAKYHDALCRLGAQMKQLALEEPGVFRQFEWMDEDGGQHERALEDMAVS